MSEADPDLTVTFERDRKLFGDLVVFAQSRANPRFVSLLTCLAIVPIVALIGILLRNIFGFDVTIETLVIGAATALLLYLTAQTLITNPRKFVQDGGWFLNEATVTISGDQLKLEQSGMICLYDWSQILEVCEGQDYLVFQTDKADGVIIPKTAFSSEEHLLNFVSTGREFAGR